MRGRQIAAGDSYRDTRPGWAVGQRLSLDQVIDEALRGQA